MKISLLLANLVLGLLVGSCAATLNSFVTKSGRVDEYVARPPFTVHTTGSWDQSLWGPTERHVSHTILYQGKGLLFSNLPNPKRSEFAWFLALPGARLLLADDGLDSVHYYWHRLYALDLPNGRPRLQPLGLCSSNTLATNELHFDLTPDSLGLLVATPDTLGSGRASNYRFFDLRTPGTFTPLPPDPNRADGAPLEVYHVGWSPDGRQVARAYYPHTASGEGLAVVFDRRTRQQYRLALEHATDSVPSQAGFDQLRWQPTGDTYRLVRK